MDGERRRCFSVVVAVWRRRIVVDDAPSLSVVTDMCSELPSTL